MFRRIALSLCAGVVALTTVAVASADATQETNPERSGYIVASS